jgi:NADH-quinone oxidoreductase subunit N
MIVAIGFKLAIVPFHFWAADVYQGAPAPVTSFIATVSKIGVFAVLMRFAQPFNVHANSIALYIFSGIAIASMIAGNVLALQQKNIKRLLAYSSISHFGYLLVAFLPGDRQGVEAAVFYLLAYSLTILAAFGVITLLSNRNKDAEDLDLYKGLFWRNPLLAVILTISMLSLAGIPLTAGFIGKFMVLTSGVHVHLWTPVIVLVLTSIMGIYYYLRIISTLFAEPPIVAPREKSISPFFYIATFSTLVVLILLLVYIGIYPSTVIENIRQFLTIG